MQSGTIRRQGEPGVVGRWQADTLTLAIDTEDPDLGRHAAEILGRPQTIPVHGPDRLEFAADAVPAVETPATIRHLALVALELEARGYVMEPEEAEPE